MALVEKLVSRTAGLGAAVVALTDRPAAHSGGGAAVPVPRSLGPNAEDLFPLLAAGTHNLLLHHVARLRGIEAGFFRYGSKVTEHE